MAGQRDSSDEESVDYAPFISDTRQYSEFVLFFVNNGRFQHNSLTDSDRRKGVLNLLQAERVVKLTKERRLSPVNLSLTPGGPKQRVYLIAICRSEVTNEELDYLVQRMNKHIEGLSSDDKESAVIDLIFSTGSRIMPGLRYLPLHWYPPGEYVGPDVILDEDNRRVDGKGKPIVDTDDEVVAIVQGEGGGKHDSNDVPMPSSTAILSDPSTDSERGPGSYRKKRKVPRFEFPTDQDDDIDEGAKRPKLETTEDPEQPRPGTSTQGDQQKPSTSFATEDVILVDDDELSAQGSVRSGNEVITREELNRELAKFIDGFGELKSLVQNLAKQDDQTLAKNKPSTSKASTSTKQITRDDTPEYTNEAESRVLALFPINYYSQAMEWLVQQPIVQDLIKYEVMRDVYRLLPVFKPESNTVLERFMDIVLSVRLQTHMGKPTPRSTTHDYGRFTMPMVFLQIAQDKLAGLGKLRAPGAKDVADFMKDRCTGFRRTKVLCGPFMAGSDSVQQLAHRIMNERMDFAKKHKWIFDKLNQKKWTFEIELEKTKKLKTGMKHKDDPTFDGAKVPFEPHIEDMVFPDMDKGTELDDMDQARALVADLEAFGLTKPTFPRHVWDTVKMIVQPSPVDVAQAKKIQSKKAATRDARLAHRRRTYADKKASQAKDDDSDYDEVEEIRDEATDEPTDQPLTADDPNKESQQSDTGGKYKLGPLSREDHVRGLFGSVSDISSDSPQSTDGNDHVGYKVQGDGTMQFTATTENEPVAEGQENEPGTEEAMAQGQGNVTLTTTEVMKAAEASGLVDDAATVIVSCDKTDTSNSEFSIMIRSPTDEEATVVTRGETQSRTAHETLTKPPKEKTAIQKYQDMEESAIDQAALEGRSSSSSDAEEQNPIPKHAQPQDANGGVAVKKAADDTLFKAPLPVAKKPVTTNPRSIAKGPKDDDMADFKAPFKPPRPLASQEKVNGSMGHGHGTRSKTKAAKKEPKDKKAKSKNTKKSRK